MALTLRAVLDELDRLSEYEGPLDEIGREQIVNSVARAALLGARGNSGVILSQLIRGAAEELISRPGELVDPVLIGAAMARASDRAYGSVRHPAEGTILTVVREMAHRIATELAHMPQTRLTVEAVPDEQDALLAQLLEQAIDAGEESVKRGPDLLPVLREAGVVDAGGYGLVVIFAGVVAALRGDAPPPVEHYAPARVTHPQHHSSSYRYCTNFAVTGDRLEAAPWIDRLEAIGDSVLVVGDAQTLKVHLHTDHPEQATDLFDGVADGLAARRRRHAPADGRAHGPARRRRRRRAGRLRRARGRGGRRHGGAVRLARRGPAQRRPDAQPVHLRPAGGHPRRPGRGGRRARQLPERDHGLGARRRAVGQDRARRALPLAAGRPGRRGGARPGQGRRRQRRGDGGGARPRAHRRGHRGRARRHLGPLPPRRGGRLRRRGARRVGRARRDARDRARRARRATPSS